MVKDKIETLNERLRKVKEAFDDLKNSGINQEVLEIYLHDKTGISKKKVKALLKNAEEFFDNLIQTETAGAI